MEFFCNIFAQDGNPVCFEACFEGCFSRTKNALRKE